MRSSVVPGFAPALRASLAAPSFPEVSPVERGSAALVERAGEPLNAQDFVLQAVPRHRERLIADLLPPPSDEDPATRLVRWDIVLRRG